MIILFNLLFLLLCLTACNTLDFTNASVEKVADLQGVPKQGYQGMAIWKDYLVSLQNTGQATIYRLQDDKLQFLRQFPLASNTPENHANVAFFGKERYDKSDQFPLLYISQCSKQRYNGLKDVCFVERISLTGEPQLVQTIVLNDKEGLFGYALQWIIDNKEWLFSGVGVVIVAAIVKLILRNNKKKHKFSYPHNIQKRKYQ